MSPPKCLFAQNKLRYLGYVLQADGISPDPTKLNAIKQAKPPTNAKMLKSWLGLTSFYRAYTHRNI